MNFYLENVIRLKSACEFETIIFGFWNVSIEMYVKLVNMPNFVITTLDILYAFMVEYAY